MNHLNQEGTVYDPLSVPYNYKYNGKELQETGFYDYGWRQYMPDIARWNGVDQLSESYASFSPYAYVMNNPVMMFDPDGRVSLEWLNNLWDKADAGGATTYSGFDSYGNYSFSSFFGMEQGTVTDFYNFLSGGGTGNYTYWTNSAVQTAGSYAYDGHSINIKGYVSNLFDQAGDFFNDHFVLKAEATGTFGLQLGGKTPWGSIKGGVMTGTLGKIGWSNQKGGYLEEGDGKGHNFISANINILKKEASVGAGVDYVTDDILPPAGDLLEYYPNNGKALWQANVGPKALIGSPKGSAAESFGVFLKANGNISNKEDCASCISISAGLMAFLGLEGRLLVGFK